MRKLAVAFLLVGAALATSGCLGSGDLVGERAPPFRLVTSDGQVVNETTHLGRYLVLDLMATWCGPCVLEVAHLKEIQARYGDRVEILSVGVDPNADTLESLQAFADEHGVTWPHAVDDGRKLARAYGLGIIPKLVVIDPEGIVVLDEQGEVLPVAIARVIDPAGATAPGGNGLAFALVALLVGFLAPFNPYRRFHRETQNAARAHAAAALLLAVLALLAWRFSAFASSRATYGSLMLGAVGLGAAAWWLKARRKAVEAPPTSTLGAAVDRAYEAAPHFALTIVLALQGVATLEYAAPVAAFLGGLALGALARPRLPETNRTTFGLLGLAVAGAGLLAFGSRILAATLG